MIQNKKLTFYDGLISGFPIFIGYVPVAIAFGLLSKTTGITLLESFFCSVWVFAGASQFMALNLIRNGVAFAEIILATMLLNMRHLLMSASLTTRMQQSEKNRKWLPLIAFGITDETFSVASTQESDFSVSYMLALELFSYSGWVGGTVLGYMIGFILPTGLQTSMGIALYAMFIALLIPQVKKSLPVFLLAVVAGILNSFFYYLRILPSNWGMIISIIVTAFMGVFIFKENEGND